MSSCDNDGTRLADLRRLQTVLNGSLRYRYGNVLREGQNSTVNQPLLPILFYIQKFSIANTFRQSRRFHALREVPAFTTKFARRVRQKPTESWATTSYEIVRR